MRVLPLVLLLVGGVLAFVGWRLGGEARASAAWPATDAVVESARVVEQAEANEKRLFRAAIRYRYQVGDTRYSGERVSYDMAPSPQPGIARAIVERYPAGASVKVFYDPSDPSRAVLEPGGAIAPWVLVGLGAFLAVAGAALFLRSR